MSAHPLIIGCLLGVAAALCLACGIGVAVMRDPFQRLQFSSPITSVAITLIAIAVWVDDSQWQSRLKATIIAIVLFLMNSILAHATARAIRVRQRNGRWAVGPEEHMPLVKDRGEVAAPGPLAGDDGDSQ